MTSTLSVVCNRHNHIHFDENKYWWGVLIEPHDKAKSGTEYKFAQYEDGLEWFSETGEVTRDSDTWRDAFISIMPLGQ
jgi:hypothetical protein